MEVAGKVWLEKIRSSAGSQVGALGVGDRAEVETGHGRDTQ